MNRSTCLGLASALLAALAVGSPHMRAEDAGETEEKLVREIYVPFDQLNVLLDNDVRRVFLERDQYDELLSKAQTSPGEDVPHGAVVLSAAYDATISEQRAGIDGTLEIDVLDDGLQALPLAFSGVGIRNASLDGQAAALGRDEQGRVTLFIQGKGRRRLSLQLVAPLQTSAAQQMLDFQLPTPAATTFSVAVPGNVELKSGASVIRRFVDQQAGQTQFDLLLPKGRASLVMSLNNRMLQRQRVVVARSVVVDEVTSAYERLHATVTLDVLHGAADRFQFALPEGFEPTHVESPALARWEVAETAEGRLLDILLRAPETEAVTLRLSATRTPAVLDQWSMPQLTAQDVAGQVAILGLLVEDRLQTEDIESSRLIPLNHGVMQAAMPDTVLDAEAGAAVLHPVAAYYAPSSEFELSASFRRPPAEFEVTSNVVLTLAPTGHRAKCAFVLAPEMEKLFDVRIAIPEGWHVGQVTDGEGGELASERYDDRQAGSWLHVRLAGGVAIGDSTTVLIHATSVPRGWLGQWDRQDVQFPAFAVLDAAADEGALAIQADEDFIVRPAELSDVMPLDDNEKAKYGLGGVPARLAYRYDRQPYTASFVLTRQEASLTARSFAFLKISPESLTAHYELVYDVRQARTRELALVLPVDTPASLSIRGLDGLTLKESRSEEADGTRRWIASLAEPKKGVIRLAVDFEQPLPDETDGRFELPLPRADGVEYESGIVSIEGHADLDIQVDSPARLVDVGELAAADYRVGRRLLGAYSYVGSPPAFAVNIQRRPGYELRTAIVQRAEMWTQMSTSGRAQTAARYQLRTKVQYMEVELPARAELWSVYLDGKPVAPQREDDRLLFSLPANQRLAVRDLQIVFETPVSPIALSGEFRAHAPKLLLRASRESESREVPTADLVWRLKLPEGYELVRSSGTVYTEAIETGRYGDPRRSPAMLALGAIYKSLGGFMSPIQAARESARRARVASGGTRLDYAQSTEDEAAESPYYLEDDVQYAMPQSESMPSDESPSEAYGDEFESGYGADAGGYEAMPAEGVDMNSPLPGGPGGGGGGGMGGGGMGGDDMGLGGYAGDAMAPGSGEPLPPSGRPAAQQTAQAVAPRPEPETPPAPPKQRRKAWALEGIRSLQIDIQETGDELVFRSLGVDPRLNLTVVHRQRIESLAWGVAAVLLLIGLVLTGRPARTKVRFLVSTGLATLLLPPLLGMSDQPASVFDAAFYAVCILAPYYLAVALLKRLACGCCRVAPSAAAPSTAVMVLLACGLATLADSASAQTPPPAVDASALLDLLQPAPPIKLPQDAVIIPYALDQGQSGVQGANRVLVPYAKYVELWNRAFPDERIQAEPPVAAYSLAGAAYRATLSEGDDLLLVGHLDLDVFVEGAVQIPLKLQGGVLEQAMMDGKRARLQLVEPNGSPGDGPSPQPAQQLAQQPAPNAPATQQRQQTLAVPERFALLHVAGPGRKRLDLTVRMRLERRGGWRLASGTLPVAPATALTLTVPSARTEVRLADVPDRGSYETSKANERIETALAGDGRLGLQWRPQVAEGEVDHSLTVQSDAVLDVREDRLRLVWRLNLDFPRSRRDAFTVFVPAGYLIEKVSGGNVRGWTSKNEDDRQRIEVTLLKEAQAKESLTLTLSRRDAIDAEGASQFDVPLVSVEGAALHKGRLTLRRSPLLELTITGVAGLTRANIDGKAVAQLLGTADEDNALVIQPYQAYEFTAVPFSMPVRVSPARVETIAAVRSLLRIAERESTLESQVKLQVQGKPVHQVRIAVPPSLDIERLIAPGDFSWAVTDEDARRIVSVYLGAGQPGAFEVRVLGSLGARTETDPVSSPRIEVLDVTRQQGDIVVQLDPAFAVQATAMKNCHTVLLDRVRSWLTDEQRPLARFALHYDVPDYEATFAVTPRKPRVNGYTVTNVKVTDVAIEDTIIIDLSIRDAGIRRFSFLLPAWMDNPRIQAPMLRQMMITDAGNGYNRVQLELQGEILPEYRVLIEHDRLLPTRGDEQSEPQATPVPILEDVRTDQRYVTLEEAGRDEVAVVDQVGVELLARQQAERRWLTGILGDGITDAFRVKDNSSSPNLTFKTKPLHAVQTAGAQIGLAETLLVVDANGAYRGQQTYRVNNTTEQFLVIRLPGGARLWTATVAGEPVKPTLAPATDDRLAATGQDAVGFVPDQVRIPLIKTAEGDRDYAVVLKYGGRVRSLQSFREVDFPLIHTVNIRVAMSQVRLRVPENMRWFDFGGTMRRVYDEGAFQSGFFVYNAKQVDRLMQVWNAGNTYARLRVASNLKSIDTAVHDYQVANPDLMSNEAFNKNFIRNAEVVAQAQRQADEYLEFEETEVVGDNRSRLNDYWMRQSNGSARNVVTDLAPNFPLAEADEQTAAPNTEERFNYRWLDANQLKTADQKKQKVLEKRLESQAAKNPVRGKFQDLNEGNYFQEGKPASGGQQAGGEAMASGAKVRQQVLSQRELAREYQEQLMEVEQLEAQRRSGQQSDPGQANQAAANLDGTIRLYDQSGSEQGQGVVTRGGAGVAFSADGRALAVGGQDAGVRIWDLPEYSSLDVELPDRGVELLFTMARGDIQIQARPMPATLVDRLYHMAAIIIGGILLWVAFRMVRWFGPWMVHTRSGAAVLLILSLLCLIIGLLPVAALIGLVAAVVQLIRLSLQRRRGSTPFAAA